jgi:hypothetical protein
MTQTMSVTSTVALGSVLRLEHTRQGQNMSRQERKVNGCQREAFSISLSLRVSLYYCLFCYMILQRHIKLQVS